jgi:hypothetical protein
VDNEELARRYGVVRPTLVVLKHRDDRRVDYTGPLDDTETLRAFVEYNAIPWFMPFNDEAHHEIFAKRRNALVLFRPDSDPTHNVI